MPDVSFTTSGAPIYTWPQNIKPSDISMPLRFNTSTFTSPFTRNTQTVELPGALFNLSAAFPPVKPAVAAMLRAFFGRLRGASGRFYFPAYACRYAPPAMYQPERVTIIPLSVDSVGITCDRTNITIDATQIQYETQFGVSTTPDAETIVGTLWLNSGRAPLAEGSYISWDDATGWRHMHLITSFLRVDAAVTIKVEPPMRALPTPATPMHVHAPSAVFGLADDGQGALSQAGQLSSFAVEAVQRFPLSITVPSA